MMCTRLASGIGAEGLVSGGANFTSAWRRRRWRRPAGMAAGLVGLLILMD
jgi:hypothetical protein